MRPYLKVMKSFERKKFKIYYNSFNLCRSWVENENLEALYVEKIDKTKFA